MSKELNANLLTFLPFYGRIYTVFWNGLIYGHNLISNTEGYIGFADEPRSRFG